MIIDHLYRKMVKIISEDYNLKRMMILIIGVINRLYKLLSIYSHFDILRKQIESALFYSEPYD